MKLKNITITLILMVLAGVTISQVALVNAAAPTVKPPVTGPVTSPITSPITFVTHLLRGKITYRFLSFPFIFSNFSKEIPAAGVKVETVNLKTGEKITTYSAANGTYSLQLKDGKYSVRPSDGSKTPFNPFQRIVQLKKDENNLNFTGIKISPISLNTISPKSGTPGQIVTLQGSGFGLKQGNVIFYNSKGQKIASAGVQKWSDNKITFMVPGLPKNTYSVAVQTPDNRYSNKLNFTLLNFRFIR